MPDKVIAEQQAAYSAVLQSLGSSSFAEIQAVLAEREQAEPETGLTPEVLSRLQERVPKERRVLRPEVDVVVAGSKKLAGATARRTPR